MSTDDLNQNRLTGIFMQTVKNTECDAIHYTYRGRSYRTRQVTVTVSELDTAGGGWTSLPQHLTEQLAEKIASGEAVET